MIQLLLHLGAHPDVIDFAGRTALMHAAEYGHVNALQLLRDARADAKIQDLEGRGESTDRLSERTESETVVQMRFSTVSPSQRNGTSRA